MLTQSIKKAHPRLNLHLMLLGVDPQHDLCYPRSTFYRRRNDRDCAGCGFVHDWLSVTPRMRSVLSKMVSVSGPSGIAL